ncbi:hypothetical protein NHQ30_000761 [Ciborinia camelliae]|nr:hypothetical protein NHQ30_000761 [Ciborinia camelliae]
MVYQNAQHQSEKREIEGKICSFRTLVCVCRKLCATYLQCVSFPSRKLPKEKANNDCGINSDIFQPGKMSRQNIAPEKQRWLEKLAFDKKRGSQIAFHCFNIPIDEDHKRFQEEEDEDHPSEQEMNLQPNPYNHIPNSQSYQSPRAQSYPYANQAPNAYLPEGSTNNAPFTVQGQTLPHRWTQPSANPRYGSYMTQNSTTYNSEMGFSTPNNFTNNQLPTAHSAPPGFFNVQQNQNIPTQGVSNNTPSTTPIPKSVEISMFSPKDFHLTVLRARCDTGTDPNWINTRIVDRLKFRVERGKPIKHLNFNGQSFISGETVKATWSLVDTYISHECYFQVIDDAPFDVLFGYNLLTIPEINYFKHDVVDTDVLLEQSDISVSAVLDRIKRHELTENSSKSRRL